MTARLLVGDVRHGEAKGYQYYGCRCDLCRAANTRYFRDRRANVIGSPRQYVRIPATERIARFIGEPTPTGCIEFTGARNARGYGKMTDNGRPTYAHRIVWEAVRGPIPSGMQICHRCDNPPCVNIEHLFVGTSKDNMRDMVAKGRQHYQRRTHCSEGHPFEGENILLVKYGDGKVMRRCRICVLANGRKNYWKRKASRAATQV